MLALIALSAGAVRALPDAILGRRVWIWDPNPPARRRIHILAMEPHSDDVLVGDPTVSGATATIRAEGGTTTEQSFDMPAAGWRPLGAAFSGGFQYYDPGELYGPVRLVRIKGPNPQSLQSRIRIFIRGNTGVVGVIPPNPGDNMILRFKINGGSEWCVVMGTLSLALNPKDTPSTFRLLRSQVEVGCPTTTTSTTSTSTTTSST